MEALALRYRPTVFADLVGQKPVQVILRQMVAANRVPTGLLFDGAPGTGKTTTARILAAALNCETPPGPCGVCPSCKAVAAGTSLDVVEIDAASNGLVDDIRALRNQVMYCVGGRCRVVILDEAHSMSGAAFDALLKTLEEPPPDTVFVLLTTEPARLPDTVVNRCMGFTFRRIGIVDIAARLRHICQAEAMTVEDGLLTVLAERADGSMRNAIMALDQMYRAGITTLAGYTDVMGDGDDALRLALCLAAGDTVGAYAVADDALSRTGDPTSIINSLVGVYKDVLIIGVGAPCHRQGPALAARTQLASQLDPTTVVAAMRVLWDLKTRLCASDDARVGIDLAVTLIGEAHTRQRPAAPAPAAPPARPLTLAQMAQMAP